ncbi:MAG: hypothetical protein Q9210_003717 [Variospora velana]
MVRAVFGLQSLIPQLQHVSVLEGHSRFSKKARLKSVVEDANDDLGRLRQEKGWEGDTRVRKTVVILDSRLRAITTSPLMAGEEPWQQLLEYLDDPSSQSGCLALAVVGLAFEAVGARWVHYILCMHNYIASVEERVYENPADDSRTGALWSVSKQLLQAERLLKFHILLLENTQNDFGGLTQGETLPAEWLRLNLNKFKG